MISGSNRPRRRSAASYKSSDLSEPRRFFIPHLADWLIAASIVLVLAVFALPIYNSTNLKGAQTKSLAQAKQIALALKVFASDHDGVFPRAGLTDMLGAKPKDSNEAFAVLIPQYLNNESLFGNKLSAYQTRPPDNLYDTHYTGIPSRTLMPGENVYAYVAGLTDTAPPSSPLVADGTDGTGHYTTDRTRRGGVWEGGKAIVIRLDISGIVETTFGPDNARYVPRRGNATGREGANLLDVSAQGPGVRLLDPAVASATRP